MVKQLVLIEADNCVSGVTLEHEVKQVLPNFKNLDLEVLRDEESARGYVDRHNVEKLPALLLIDNDTCLGLVYGYQPAFILEVWLQSLLEKGN